MYEEGIRWCYEKPDFFSESTSLGCVLLCVKVDNNEKEYTHANFHPFFSLLGDSPRLLARRKQLFGFSSK